jgi:predicted nucleic acid-binding protein
MSTRDFFDTNVVVYFFSVEGRHTEVAEGLLVEGGVVSVQVLNELVSVAHGKLRMNWDEIRRACEKTLKFCPNPVPLTEEIHRSAVEISARYGYPIYDSLILAAAMQAGCTRVYSQDMQNGQTIGKLTIVNPFLACL